MMKGNEGQDDDSTKASMKKLVRDPLFILGAIGSVFFLLNLGQMGPTQTDKSIIYYGYFILTLFSLKASWIAMKNKTPKLISNPYFTTTRGKFRAAGEFLVFSMGDISAAGVSVKGSDGTVIGPKDAVQKLGDNIALNVKTEEKSFGELPAEVRNVVKEHDFKEPYYMGYANEEQLEQKLDDNEQISGMNNPDVSRVIRQLEETNEMNKFLVDIVDDKYDKVEDVLEAMDRIGVHKDGGMADKIKSAIDTG